MSLKAIKKYINPRDNRLKLNEISKDADALPTRFRNWKDFKKSFSSGNYYAMNFHGYNIVIDLSYAFKHFSKNTYNEDREIINGVIKPILTDPLLVVKDNYNNQNSLTFYKPFKSKNGLHHILLFQLFEDSDGQYKFKTVYEVHDNLNKIKNIIRKSDRDTIYFKHD